MREEATNKIEVHVAGIAFYKDKVLIAKRSPERQIYPNLWECGGGQVKVGENFEEALKRQYKEEFGTIIEPIKVIDTYEIIKSDLEQKKIPGIKFVCRIKEFVNGVEPEISNEHIEWKLLNISEIDKVNFIEGIQDEIQNAVSEMFE